VTLPLFELPLGASHSRIVAMIYSQLGLIVRIGATHEGRFRSATGANDSDRARVSLIERSHQGDSRCNKGCGGGLGSKELFRRIDFLGDPCGKDCRFGLLNKD
jgi:hypothetical protein